MPKPPLLVGLALALLLALVAGACGSSDDDVQTRGETDTPIPVEPDNGIGDTPLGDIAFFGGNDGQCPSTTLTNDVDDLEVLADAVDCFFTEYDAGTPVVWDLSWPTVEGDPILHRFAYDGETVRIVIDNRLDKFGSPTVDAKACAALDRTDLLPEGIDCSPIDHPGFPEAD